MARYRRTTAVTESAPRYNGACVQPLEEYLREYVAAGEIDFHLRAHVSQDGETSFTLSPSTRRDITVAEHRDFIVIGNDLFND